MDKIGTRFWVVAAVLLATGLGGLEVRAQYQGLNGAPWAPTRSATAAPGIGPDRVDISNEQARQLKVEVLGQRRFTDQRDAVGYIDFNQDRNVPVSVAWTGRIREVPVESGQDVRAGQLLFTLDSPDLVQAESTLISSAGVLALANRSLERAGRMVEAEAGAAKDLEQARSDQQTADANYRAAVDAVRIFGKTPADIERIASSRQVDGELAVVSPIAGRVTARSAAPGQLVQPGAAPAPITVADIASLWMVGNLPEADAPLLRRGAPVRVAVAAWPGREFDGRIDNIAAALDPATHRIAVRCVVRDPGHELRPQMMATFRVQVGPPRAALALPENGLVREGDGSFSAFVQLAPGSYRRRSVRIGLQQDGHFQVLSGLAAGDRVVSDGALFLSNALALQGR